MDYPPNHERKVFGLLVRLLKIVKLVKLMIIQPMDWLIEVFVAPNLHPHVFGGVRHLGGCIDELAHRVETYEYIALNLGAQLVGQQVFR